MNLKIENLIEIQKDNISAINSEDLKKLILYIYDCRDKLSKILEDSQNIALSTETFYKTMDGDEFREKFQEFSATFSVFLTNIKSYGEDLERVLNKYKYVDLNSIDIFKKK